MSCTICDHNGKCQDAFSTASQFCNGGRGSTALNASVNFGDVTVSVQKWKYNKNPALVVSFKDEPTLYNVATFKDKRTAEWFVEVISEACTSKPAGAIVKMQGIAAVPIQELKQTTINYVNALTQLIGSLR